MTRFVVRWLPATVYACSSEGDPATELNGPSDATTSIEGGGSAVPATSSVWAAVPLTCVIDPLEDPGVARSKRTYTVVAGTVPLEGVRLSVGPNPKPLESETSKSVVAVMTRFVVRLLPATV
jgi:hypothetical protein